MVNINLYKNRYLFPSITLEPIGFNEILKRKETLLDERQLSIKKGLRLSFYQSARHAIKEIYSCFEKGEVEYYTTSRSTYVSSCLTNIKGLNLKFDIQGSESRDSMYILDFGYYRYQDLENLTKSLIIDDAWSFNNEIIDKVTHSSQAHYVTSMPKIMGTPFGSIVICSEMCKLNHNKLDREFHTYLENSMQNFLIKYEQIQEARNSNLSYFINGLANEGLTLFFDNNYNSDLPGAAIFKSKRRFDEKKFKSELQNFGVRGTSFFGNQSIVLPCHQNLSEFDLDYIISATAKSISLSLA